MIRKNWRNAAVGAERWISATASGRPWAISVEVTHACNADCGHCDKGGPIPDEKRASPEAYAELVRKLKPLVVQISGGEPLLRDDIEDIVRRVRNPDRLPYVVFVTNAALLTAERYDRLKALGVDEFSVSLDFPDRRHDENRKIPGLFDRLNRLIPELTARGHRDFTLITAVTRLNYRYLPEMLSRVRGWGARYNLSMYTAGRTGNRDLCITGREDLADFRDVLDRLWEENRKAPCLFSSREVLNRYYDFFANGCSAPGCRAGVRSLVVNPDGSLCPCAMKKDDTYATLGELKRGFVSRNACDGCYISLRANTEKPFRELFRDLWRSRDRI